MNLKRIDSHKSNPYSIYIYKVDVKNVPVNYLDFLSWCTDNCVGNWDHIGRYFYFEKKDDKIAFLQKWC